MKFYVKMQKSIKSFVSLLKSNKKRSILIGMLFLFVGIVVISVVTSLARVGFNMNVVFNQDLPKDAWYTKLVNKVDRETINYEKWDGSVANSFSGGTGTESDPFIISNVSELMFIKEMLDDTEYQYSDGSPCREGSNAISYTTSSTSERYRNGWYYRYRGTYTVSISNVGDTTLSSFNVTFTDNDTIEGLTVNGTNVGNNITNVTFSYTLNPGESVDLVINYSNSQTNGSSINITGVKGYDDNNLEYINEGTCSYQLVGTKNKYFKIVNNLDFAGYDYEPIGSSEYPFMGVIDGGYHHYLNFKLSDSNDSNVHYLGLFGYTNNATIKNFIFEDATLELNGTGINYAGLLVGYANGSSKIYNNGVYSGNVNILRNINTDSYVGSLVGYIDGTTVVANSYSYANFKSSGNNNISLVIGGLVGYRDATSNSINTTDPFVYLLVYYGSMDIKSCESYQFVYNGTIINASSTPTYCYYLWLGDINDTNSGVANTYAILKSYDDILASGFKAHLNNYRYMVNYYVGNSGTITNKDTNGFSDIAIWYSLNSESFYPIIKEYSGDVDNSHISTSSGDNKVKVNLVNTSNNNQTITYYIDITEKNENINDYTNHKITLPYNSVNTKFIYGTTGKNGNYTMTLSGWELVSVVQDGKTYNQKIDGSLFNYNYALRSGEYSASKDIGTIYAQGGFYLVPDGVTEITLNTKWAYTIYAQDAYYDMVYQTSYQNGTSTGYGSTGASDNNNGLTPETPVATLNGVYSKVANISSSNRGTFYDVVVMLVGNLHFSPTTTTGAGSTNTSSNWAYTSNDRPITFMSMDNDLDLNPDYALYTRNIHDQNWPSLRFDFVSILQIPQVGTINAKLNAMTLNQNATFEVTETVSTDRIDLRHYQASFVKLNAGYYDIYSLWLAEAQTLRKDYLYFGGYAQAIYLTSGVESRQLPALQENELPVFVITGGRVETLSATYFGTQVSASNDVYFYLDGGYIDKFYTTYNASLNESAIVTMNGTYVNTYYAGGHTESAYVYGGVETNVFDSRIGDFYGGPEFGTIENGSIINIERTEIDKFFGSGYGGTQTTEINLVYQDSGSGVCGTSDYYYNISNNCNLTNSNNRDDSNRSYCFGRTSAQHGIETAFYAIIYSKSGCASKGFATYYSSLSAANVDHVFVNMKDSVINKDFYGGGNKGIVDNSVVVNMENTTVKGDLYGGGLSNATETLEVFENTTGYVEPKFISYTVDIEATYPQKYTYTWSGDTSKFSGNSVVNTTEKLIYSENDGKLGNVNGEIYLNIKDSNISGSLYGGGNLSEVNGDININLSGDNIIGGSLYGGGNQALVIGTTDVRVSSLTVESVYGGGNVGDVTGTASVTVLGGSKITNLFGGGNEASVTTSNIYIENGIVDNVYGGSNSSGTVEISNVYTGVINTDEQKDGSHITVDQDNSGSSSEGDSGGNNGGNTSTEQILETECTDADMHYVVNFNSSDNSLDMTLMNDTNTRFNTYTVTIVTEGVTGIDSNWSGTNTSYSNGVITMTQRNQWWGTNTIDAGSTRTMSKDNLYLTVSGDVKIVSVTITATGANGTTYSSTICRDVIEPEPEPEPDPEPEPEPDQPGSGDVDRPIDVTIGNLFGGNNLGGSTGIANVFVHNSTVTNIYGGGNFAPTDHVFMEVIENSSIKGNVYGGGNNGIISNNTSVIIKDVTINGSAYAGGNGSGATVLGNTYINVSGDTLINKSLFGGGNAAETGSGAKNNSLATTILAGGTVNGSVYGGANTSKIWGEVDLIIGNTTEDVTYSDIHIGGTVFGGGEANADGSENYDYSYISVTVGIDISIDVKDGYDITIDGSIFGSGNASSSGGYSNIVVNNFGTREVPKNIISIQRAGSVELINSSVEVAGTTDTTNEFVSYVYSLSRIKHLKLINGSTLYVRNGTNVVEEVSSYKRENGTDTVSKVDITEDGISSNVDNRLYMMINKAFNILDSENLSTGTFGNVNGMMFFGLYELDREGLPDTGFYHESVVDGETVTDDEAYQFMGGSYVMGLHKDVHDITKDGFYTNFVDEDSNTINVDYINPIPEDAVYYQWSVGEASTIIQLSLTASKFATMGTAELSLFNFEKPNTYFEILTYNDNDLNAGVNLINSDDVPRVAATDEDALKNFGLRMTSSNVGWINNGETYFISKDNESSINGDLKYEADNTTEIPSLYFYFDHSKNITEDIELGTVVIGLMSYTPIDEVTYEMKRIYIEVSLDTKYFDYDDYESVMRPGKEYELFITNRTNITSTSSLSAYFSLYVEKNESIYKDGFHRVLISNYKLPVNTRITMIDRTIEEKPVYYYYVVTEEDFNNVKTQQSPIVDGTLGTFYIYPLSKFISMGSTSSGNTYSDNIANSKYFDSSTGANEEEFIFIVDYSKANITEDVYNAELLMELKDEDEYTHYDSLSVSHANMVYNIYVDKHADIDIGLESDRDVAYAGYEFNVKARLDYDNPISNGVVITDTNYSQDKLGIKITMYDSNGNKVNGTSLLGTVFNVNGKSYSARLDGSVRIPVADFVTDINVNINFDLAKSILVTDTYRIVVEAFGSPDGLYYGKTSAGESEILVDIVNENYGIKVDEVSENIIVDKDSGKNVNGTNEISYKVNYTSQFTNPSIRVKLLRRDYSDVYSRDYKLVDLQDYVTNELDKVGDSIYLVGSDSELVYNLTMNSDLVTGTYKVVFMLYNNDTYIDEVSTYMIIK